MSLPEDILRAMGRLASRGEVDVSPSRIADIINPRPSEGAMARALGDLWETGSLDHGRVGDGRYRLAPAPYVPDSEQMGMEV